MTGLIGGQRVPKDDPLIEAVGDVDELISWIGVLRCSVPPTSEEEFLKWIQGRLSAVGTLIADPTRTPDGSWADDVVRIEREIDRVEEGLRPVRSFIIPGGNLGSSYSHVTRAVCRRVERAVCRGGVSLGVGAFLNRLSDYLFVLARLWAEKES